MKPSLILSMVLFVTAISAKAQNLIAVQNGKAPAFYTKLTDAVANAAAGDTLYIPGGGWESITINKSLHLIGVGDNPDSTTVTSRTIIPQILLTTGADNGSLTGVYSQQSGNNDNIGITGNIANYTISRCNIYRIQQEDNGTLSNFTIIENILKDLRLTLGSNHFISNNIIMGALSITNSVVHNNILTIVSTFTGSTSTTFENNIVATLQTNGTGGFGGFNDIFYNNINIGVNGTDLSSSQGSSNFISGTPLQSIFISYDPTTIGGDGIYKQNFNLPANSPYKNAGRDGTDIGIYGGAFPWKPGSVPFNPHFQLLKIAPQTDSSGNLKVQISVAAQNN